MFRRCLLTALLLGASPPAFAQQPSLEAGAPPLAEQRYLTGRNLYRQGNLEGAAEEFRTAFDLFPESPKLAFNLGRVSERLGRLADAADYYRAYLRLAPEAADRAEIEALVVSLDRRLADQQGTLVLTTEPLGAAVFVDGATTAAGRTPLTVRLAPGEHALRVVLDGHETALRTLDLAAGQRSALTLRLVPVEAAPPPPPPPGPRAARTPDDGAWMPWAVVGVGGAVTVTGAVLLAQAFGAADDRDALLSEGGSVDEARGLDDDARLYQGLGWAGVGVGLVAVGGGLAWWLLDDEDATVSLGPWGPAGAAAQVRF
ncbi:MAG: PEGA domain-containing protein [Myxococcales bacterium]|nr:PEGA domain-containing protein [Myxococcales bacterium]